MTDYEVALLVAILLLVVSLLAGFNAVTNHGSIGVSLVLFVIGGTTLYYATTISSGGSLTEDIPKAFYSLYAKIMN